MELRDYAGLLSRYVWLIIVLPVAFFAIGFFTMLRRPPVFEASTTLTVSKLQVLPQAQTDYYQYDGYYAQLAAALFADIVSRWLKSPGPVVEIYRLAGLEPPRGGATAVARTFRVSKGQEATVITLTVQNKNPGYAENIIETAKSVVNAKIDELKAQNNDPSFFVVAATPAEVFTVKTSPLLTGILGSISGLIVALVAGFFLAYRRPRKTK